MSQNVHVAHHTGIDRINNLVSFGSRHFYVEQVSSSGYPDSTNIVCVNNQGKTLFKNYFGLGHYVAPIAFFKTLDKQLLFVGHVIGCDIDLGYKIMKIDSSGNKVFEIADSVFTNHMPGYINTCVQTPDSSFHLTCDSFIVQLSKTGNFISKIKSGLLECYALAIGNDGSYYVCGYDPGANARMLKLSPQGAILQSGVSLPYESLQFNSSNSHLYGFTLYGNSGGKIDVLDLNLLKIKSTEVSLNSNTSVTAFTFNHDTIFFAGNLASNKLLVHGRLNLNLDLLYFSQTAYKNVHPSGMSVDNQQQITVIANGLSSVNGFIYPNYYPDIYSSFYRFPTNGSFITESDIGVSSFSLVSASRPFPDGTSVVNLKVKVKNFGTDTIRSFCLNSQASRQPICGHLLFHKLYRIKIPPKDSIVVETGNSYSYLFGSLANDSVHLFAKDICLFTTVPNDKSDKVIDNDAACSRVSFSDTAVSRQSTEGLPENYFAIWPNPFGEDLNITSGSPVIKVLLINPLGQVIRELLVNENSFKLTGWKISKGVYFLQIVTNNRTVIKKVVKE